MPHALNLAAKPCCWQLGRPRHRFSALHAYRRRRCCAEDRTRSLHLPPCAAIRNQAALLALSASDQFQFLHRLYVAIDELAGMHRVGGPC